MNKETRNMFRRVIIMSLIEDVDKWEVSHHGAYDSSWLEYTSPNYGDIHFVVSDLWNFRVSIYREFDEETDEGGKIGEIFTPLFTKAWREAFKMKRAVNNREYSEYCDKMKEEAKKFDLKD